MDGIYFVMNQMVIKNIPQSGLFLTVEYCVDSVENFHTLLWNIVMFQLVVKRLSVYTEQCCCFRFVVSGLFQCVYYKLFFCFFLV